MNFSLVLALLHRVVVKKGQGAGRKIEVYINDLNFNIFNLKIKFSRSTTFHLALSIMTPMTPKQLR